MAKQADARDLKSLGVTTVPVQIRPAAPKKAGFTTCLFYALNFANSDLTKSIEICVYIDRVVLSVLSLFFDLAFSGGFDLF